VTDDDDRSSTPASQTGESGGSEGAPAAAARGPNEPLIGSGGLYKRGTDYQAAPAVEVQIEVPQAFAPTSSTEPPAARPSASEGTPSE
jgi:hypothetical protein